MAPNEMWIQLLGYIASASVLATFCMSTMVPLRTIAIGSNILFISFGVLDHIYPVMILHIALLPVNVVRLLQIRSLVRELKDARAGELSIETIIPFMSTRTFKSGDTLVHRDERADRMFYIVRGQVRVKEIDKTLGPGSLIGEIGIFARDQRRTATVECLTDCKILELTQAKAKEIYFQDPAFGYAVLQIIVARLKENLEASRAVTSGRFH